MSFKFRSALSFFAALCVAASAHAAPPQAPPALPPPPALESRGARAANLREQGNQAMLDMRYVDALSAYEQSLALAPEYLGALYSIARAHQLLGEFPEALSTLERFD